MTKKDYIIVAKCLNQVFKPAAKIFYNNAYDDMGISNEAGITLTTLNKIVSLMFTEFAKDNPNFDWKKFKKEIYK